MSFGFGTPSFGTSSAAPAFGTSSSTPGFGQSGSLFGSNQQAAPTSFGFGTPASGTGFGSTMNTFGTSATPAFGATSSTTPAFGAAATGTTPFGATSTAAPFGTGSTFGTGSSFPSFGTGTAFPSFGATTTASSLFSGFGQTQTTQANLFGNKPFGATSTFGTSQTSAFGGTSQPSFGAFGTSTLSQPFGQNQGTSLFNQPGQQQPAPAVVQPNEALELSLRNCLLFGDTRDEVIRKFNILQARLGMGKGYYGNSVPPVSYTAHNPYCRLKTVGYSVKPTTTQSEGLVALLFNKKCDDVNGQKTNLETSLHGILGNNSNLSVHVDVVKPLENDKSLALFYVNQKQPSGGKRVSNTEICNHLLQNFPRQQLVQLGVSDAFPFSAPKDDQIDEYLDSIPAGLHEIVWKQAILENPDPGRLIPVPIVGFSDLKMRLKCQEEENKVHQNVLDNISESLNNLRRTQVSISAKVTDQKTKLKELEHRVLKLMVVLSGQRDSGGVIFGPEDEMVKTRLESLYEKVMKPTEYKYRMNEIATSMQLRSMSKPKTEECKIDNDTLKNLKEFLSLEQNAIAELKDLLLMDMEDVDKICEDVKTNFPKVSAPE